MISGVVERRADTGVRAYVCVCVCALRSFYCSWDGQSQKKILCFVWVSIYRQSNAEKKFIREYDQFTEDMHITVRYQCTTAGKGWP